MSARNNPHNTAAGILREIPGKGVVHAASDTVPTDGTAGYAPGCIFQQTDGTTGATVLYVNIGTKSSCDFNVVPVAGTGVGAALTAQLTQLTPADAAGTPDYSIAAITNTTPFGFSNAAEAITVLYVIQNLQIRVAQLESRLQAANIIA